MAIRIAETQPHGILSDGVIVTGNDINVDRLFLIRLEINPITSGINPVRRIFVSRDENLSEIRLLTLADDGATTGILGIAAERSSGNRYLARWKYADTWSVGDPRATLALRLGGTPGSGRTALWKDGTKLSFIDEQNNTGSFAGSTFSSQGCIANRSISDTGQSLPSSIDFFYAWRVGVDAYTSGNFLVSDQICEALSRGVSPIAMGMPQADIGYEFEAGGTIIRQGKYPVGSVASDGFEGGSGNYRVSPQALIVSQEVAGPPLEASLDTLGATATAEVAGAVQALGTDLDADTDGAVADIESSVEPLGAALSTDGDQASDDIDGAIAPLGTSLDTEAANAVAAFVAELLSDNPIAVLNTLGATAEANVSAAVQPLGSALAEDGATAQEIFDAQVLALGAVLETLGADAVAALSGEVIDTTPTAILNTLGAQAIVEIAAAIQPLGATLDSVGAEAADSLIASLPFIPGTSGLNLAALRKRAMAYRDRIAPSQTFRVRRNGTVFRNYDGGFPRVLRLSDSQRLLVPGVSETSTVFRVRLIVESATETAGTYELSFDGGVSWQGVRLLGSAYRDVGNNAWVFNLERGV